MGYICDSMTEQLEPLVVNQILNSIIEGLKPERSNSIRLAAVVALNNSLRFTDKNFEIQAERDAILTAICSSTRDQDVKIRSTSFECLATIAEYYYDKIRPYAETLFNISTTAIKSDDQTVGMQAIEFWNTICDQEMDIIQQIEDGLLTDADYYKLILSASPTLIPLILECMTKQEEDADDDEWNIAMAAATLLEAIANTINDSVVDLVIPFVTQNINSQNWRLKEASIMAFGMILDGPSEQKISPIVSQGLPLLIQYLKDPTPIVRDTSAWTLGKICEIHKNSISAEYIPIMIEGFIGALDDQSSNVVSQACYAVHNLAEAVSDENESNSNILSQFLTRLLEKLLNVASKDDFDNSGDNIKSSAYEAINMLVANSALDMREVVKHLLSETLSRLEQTYTRSLDAHDRMNLQSCLCSLVGEIVKKLDVNEIVQFSDRIMGLLLQVFNSKGAIAHEDAFLTIGYLAEKLGNQFSRYLPVLHPILLNNGLKNIEESQVCTVAVGVVGDISRALGREIFNFSCDDIVRHLLELLQSPVLDRSVKPHIISLFSDIAMAIEGNFDRYIGAILPILKQAGEININPDADEDLIDYINVLRNSILEAYTGILQGLKTDNKQEVMVSSLETIVDFMKRSGEDENRSEDVLKSVVGLIGDLGQAFGPRMKVTFSAPFINALLKEALTVDQETAYWAQTVS